MFWIIFSAIIYLIANRFLDKDRYDIFDTILFGIMELIIGALIGIVLYIAIGNFISPYFPSKCITTKQELYSFDNSNDYYLMNNKDENIYYYTIKNKKEKIVKKSIISSKNIKIKESNNPILIETKKEFKKKWYKWFAIEDSSPKKYEFYIPSNTMLYIQKE